MFKIFYIVFMICFFLIVYDFKKFLDCFLNSELCGPLSWTSELCGPRAAHFTLWRRRILSTSDVNLSSRCLESMNVISSTCKSWLLCCFFNSDSFCTMICLPNGVNDDLTRRGPAAGDPCSARSVPTPRMGPRQCWPGCPMPHSHGPATESSWQWHF